MNTVILVPVLNRPHRVEPLVASIEAATPEIHRVLFIAQADDTDELAALDGHDHIVVDPARRSYACKINDGYRATTEPLLFLAADDLEFHPDWLSRATTMLTDSVDVVGTNDITNPRVMCGQHSTHSLVRRSYIDTRSGVVDEPGVVLCERYDHEFTDDELIQTAMARGVYAHAFDSIVEHLHYLVGKAPMDETYRLGKLHTRESRTLFRQRRRLWQNEPAT